MKNIRFLLLLLLVVLPVVAQPVTLSTPLTATGRQATLSTVVGLRPSSLMLIESEAVLVCSVNTINNSVVICLNGRGREGTTAATHAINAPVLFNPLALIGSSGKLATDVVPDLAYLPLAGGTLTGPLYQAAAGFIGWTGRAKFNSSADGVMDVWDSAGTELAKVNAGPGGRVSAWAKYSVVKLANGAGGCESANGCWQVNGGTPIEAEADLNQGAILFHLPARGYLDGIRIKTTTACTGADTISLGLGTAGGGETYFRLADYNLKTAVADTNISDAMVTRGAAQAGAENVIFNVVTTNQNVSAIVAGCAFDMWAKWGILP